LTLAQVAAARTGAKVATESPLAASGACEPNWEIVSSPNPGAKKNYLNGVEAVSDTDVWAVGYRSENTSTQTLVQHWNGQSWSTVPSPNRAGADFNELYAVSAVSANDVWAIGHSYKPAPQGYSLRETLTMHWDGTAWTIVDSPNLGSYQNYLLDVVALASNNVWAVGYFVNSNARDQTLAMQWDGTEWKVKATPGETYLNHYLASISAVSATDIWAVGSQHTSGNTYQTLTVRWDGTQWTEVASYTGTSSRYYLFEIDASASNNVWAVGAESLNVNDSESRALVLYWNGTQWTRKATPEPSWTVRDQDKLYGVVANSANDVWVIGTRGVGTQTLVEHWNGASWTVYPSPNVPNTYNYLRAISATQGGDMWAVGDYTADPQSGLQRTLTLRYPGSDCAYPTPTITPTATPVPSCGPVWSLVDSPGTGVLHGVDVISPNDVWAVGRNASSTFTQHWDGTQWTVVSSPNPDQFENDLRAVSAVSSNDVWAVGMDRTESAAEDWPDDSLLIHWNGSAWEHVCCPNGGTLEDVEAIASNNVWAVGNGILHWDGSQWTNMYVSGGEAMSPEGDGSPYYSGISAVSANDIWAVGYYPRIYNYYSPYDKKTFIIHWNGSVWTQVPSPNAAVNGNFLQDVVALGQNNVWAVGHSVNNGFKTRTLIERWNGTAWSVVPAPNVEGSDNYLTGVVAHSATDVWAVGYYVTITGDTDADIKTLVLHWNGSEWRRAQAIDKQGGSSFNAIAAVGPNDMWAVGQSYVDYKPLVERYSVKQTCVTTPTRTPTTAQTPTSTPAACNVSFSDVPPGSTFYPYVQCLACRGIVSGASDGNFHPGNNITRGQLSKIVANSAALNDPPGGQLFEDVAPDSPFYVWIQRLAAQGFISGYPCGGTGEPCLAGNRPYFRPGANATRGQISKIVSNAAGFINPPGQQIFEDVAPGSPFYDWVQRLASRGVMGGYPCSASNPDEPCVAPNNRSYFRPNANATRGQVSKIVANTFYPACESASQP
jgi:hypothetical protein